MVERFSDSLARQRQLLSTILKMIRSERRMTARAIALGMGMPLRSYYSFESGQGALDLAEIHGFANATDSDGMAILWALAAGSPEIALRCMDNKAASILVATFMRFGDKVGDRMAALMPATLIEIFERPFVSLEEHLTRRDQTTERWLEQNLPKLFRSPKEE